MGARLRWRNGPDGYGLITKSLHWTIAVLFAVQFAVGLLMESGSGQGRGRGRGEESGRGRGRGGDIEPFGDDTMLTIHVVVGVTILVLATIRLTWRLLTPLPPWAPTLSAGERRVVTWTERTLYLLMFVIPATGLLLVVSGEDDLLPIHVAAQLAFLAVLSGHVGFVLWHQLVRRDRLLLRML